MDFLETPHCLGRGEEKIEIHGCGKRLTGKYEMVAIRQFSAFAGVGFCAAAVHYGLLIGLVERMGSDVIIATLIGYCGGGICSYWLNRRHTFQSERRHREAVWRFVLVAGVGFCLTWLLMLGFVKGLKIPYLAAQALTTILVMVWSFGAHKFWTFGLARS